MKRTLVHTALGAVFAATATMASLAIAAPPVMSVGAAPFAAPPLTAPGKNKLKCFDGPSEGAPQGGSCTMQGRGAMGPAILDNSSTDPDGDYSGVYYTESSIYGSPLSSIKQLGYHWKGSIEPQPGNLSLNIPIDEDGDGDTEGYAFVDAFYCPGTDGVVDVLNDEECGIFYLGIEYANWDALVAAFPDALVADDNFAFVIAERTPAEPPATWRINAVKFGKPGNN
jgi:hypothetical protein